MARTGKRRDPDDEGSRPPDPPPAADGDLALDPPSERAVPADGEFPVGATTTSDFAEVGPNSLAPLVPRALQRISDFVLSVMVPQALAVLAFGETVENDQGDDVVSLPFWVIPVLIAVLGLYEIGLVAWRGQTVGMMVGRLRVARLVDGETPSIRVAMWRAGLPLLAFGVQFWIPISGLVYVALYLTPLADQKLRQGIPDKVAGTVVVRTR